MGRYTGPRCRICRKEGTKLFLKGDKCFSDHCPFNNKGYPPGDRHIKFAGKMSDFGIRLREKQKIRKYYGLSERQFKIFFHRAERLPGKTGENLLALLERRLDNFVFRCGFAPSRAAARQLVGHRHFTVNGRIVNIPSYILKVGDVVKVKEKSRGVEIIHHNLSKAGRVEELSWLQIDKAKLEGKLLTIPTRDQIPVPLNEQLIVEFYSR